MLSADEEDRLLATALTLAGDVRNDLAQAHRTVAYMTHPELQQLCVCLAAMVDENVNLNDMAWWRSLQQETA